MFRLDGNFARCIQPRLMQVWIACMLCLVCAVPAAQGAANAENVLQTVRTKALFPPQDYSALAACSDRDSAGAIREFLASFDPWATWSEAQERQQAQQLRVALGSGVGLDIVRNRAGELICLPYPNSPAQRGGLEDSDILIAVDGYSVVGADLDDVAVLILGKAGTTVVLTVARPHLNSQTPVQQSFSIQRGSVKPPRVHVFRHEGTPALTRIRLYRFDEKTAEEFSAALKTVGSGPLVLDIRGNSGGQLLAALSCAAQFLPKGSWLYTAVGSGRNVRKITEADGLYAGLAPLVIWQDQRTASAAEVFVAALVDNWRAVSLGEPTYGKARVQEVFTFGSSVLELTTEALMRADNSTWQETGLAPQILVSAQHMAELLQTTHESFGRTNQQEK